MNVGYACVSSKDQNLDRQIAALHDAGVERIFADKQSGKDFERVEYKAMMKRLRAGELFKKQQSLIKPIQDDIYNACKKVCEERGFQVIFDRASIQGAIYVSPRIDVTDDVIAKLGY